MYYVLVDGEGNRLGAFDEEWSACEEFRAIVAADPAAADDVLLVRYQDEGGRAGQALTFAEVEDAVAAFNSPCPVVVTASGRFVVHSMMLAGAATATIPPPHPEIQGSDLIERWAGMLRYGGARTGDETRSPELAP